MKKWLLNEITIFPEAILSRQLKAISSHNGFLKHIAFINLLKYKRRRNIKQFKR